MSTTKKKVLGSEAEALFKRGTPAEVVTVAAGRKTKLATVPEPEPEPEEGEPYKVTTVRLLTEQFFAVQDEAVKRHRARGGRGKPDISEVFREAIAEWMKAGGG